MKITLTIILFSLLWLFTKPVQATHIAGGEMTYEYLGNDTYLIKMSLYRDCYNGIAPFDSPASVAFFDSANQMILNYHPSVSITTPLSNIVSCLPSGVSTVCFEKGIYEMSVVLPPRPGGYQIAYQRCCRPTGITNVTNANAMGITCYATIPGSIFANNSSPFFINDPFTFQCLNTPFTFDNSAIDTDGDSLVYSLYTPLHGADQSNPMPDPPANPPYDTIAWLNGYSVSNMLGSTTPMSIDSVTGILSGTPGATGIYLYGISVKEFRNGVFLGETRRDFQMSVINVVGVNEIENEKTVKIFPNPVEQNAMIHIDDFTANDFMQIVFYNSLGEIVKTLVCNEADVLFERENLPAGIYTYRLLKQGVNSKSGNFILK